jgi:hypothetical protein
MARFAWNIAAMITTLWISSAMAQTPIKEFEAKGLKPLSE